MTPIQARILRTVVVTEDGCWQWTGSLHTLGYARVKWREVAERSVHRIAYSEWKGAIPDGLTIDHLCRNRACVNPDHLEAVSQRENVLRGTSFAATNAAKDECVNGHALSGDNLYLRPSSRNPAITWRQCKACNATNQRRHQRKAS